MAKYPVTVLTEDALEAMRRISTANKATKAKLHDTFRKTLVRAKYQVVGEARQVIGTGYKNSHGDPNESYKSVRANVWNENLGGSLTILDDKSGTTRGYILRWLSGGTKDRVTGGRNQRKGGTIRVRANGHRIAYRGKIKGNGWFESSGMSAVNTALESLGNSLPDALEKRFADDN